MAEREVTLGNIVLKIDENILKNIVSQVMGELQEGGTGALRNNSQDKENTEQVDQKVQPMHQGTSTRSVGTIGGSLGGNMQLRRDYDKLKSDHDTLRKDYEHLKGKNTTLEDENIKLKAENDKNAKKINAQRDIAESEINKRQSILEQQEQEISELKSTIEEKENAIHQHASDITDLEGWKTKAKLYVKDLQQKLSDEEGENNVLREEKVKLKNTIEEKNKEIKDLEESKQTLETTIVEKNNAIKGLEENKQILETTIVEKNNAIKGLEENKQTLETTIVEKNNAIKGLEENKQTLETTVAEKNKEIKGLEDNKETLENTIDLKNNKIKSLEKDLRKEKGEVSALTTTLSNTFGTGQDVYKRAQDLEEEWKKRLEALTPLRTIESFLISLTGQESTLIGIWKIAKDAVLAGETKAYNTLWAILQYGMDLIKESRGEEIYKFDTVEVGNKYNTIYVESDGNSKAQGEIKKIYILGIRNAYMNDKVLCKSYVHVG